MQGLCEEKSRKSYVKKLNEIEQKSEFFKVNIRVQKMKYRPRCPNAGVLRVVDKIERG